MNWLKQLIAPYRPHIIGAIGVLMVCGIMSTAVAWLHIKAQGRTIAAQVQTIEEKDRTISGLGRAIRAQVALRRLEQRNTLLLQDKVALIEAQSSDMSNKIKELEASNAEVREFMARPIPDDLRRLLEER